MDEFKGRLTKDGIRIHDPSDFAGMHRAGALAADILDRVADLVIPGATTGSIDAQIEAWVEQAGATSATIGYRGYKHASCISVNHVVCHGIPGDKRLKDGDILNIDVTVILDGWFGDTSRMYVAGAMPRKAQRLVQVTHDALFKGIEVVKPGKTFGDRSTGLKIVAVEVKAHVENVLRCEGKAIKASDDPTVDAQRLAAADIIQNEAGAAGCVFEGNRPRNERPVLTVAFSIGIRGSGRRASDNEANASGKNGCFERHKTFPK